jgi:hypothetical protein
MFFSPILEKFLLKLSIWESRVDLSLIEITPGTNLLGEGDAEFAQIS